MNFFEKLFKGIFGGLFKQPKIIIPPAPPPPPPPSVGESAEPIVTGKSSRETIRRARLGRRRFVTNAALGIPTIGGGGLGIPGGSE